MSAWECFFISTVAVMFWQGFKAVPEHGKLVVLVASLVTALIPLGLAYAMFSPWGVKWSMSALSSSLAEKARKAHAMVLRTLQENGKAGSIAVALGVSDSTISRCKTEQLEGAIALIVGCGFKIVPQSVTCFETAKVNALLTLAKGHLDGVETAEQLEWE
jgi:hypothetical protein